MTHVHVFRSLTPTNRIQDSGMDGETLKFETLEHGGAEPDLFPNAVKVTDTAGRWCVYAPVRAGGQDVQSLGYFTTDDDDMAALKDAVASMLGH